MSSGQSFTHSATPILEGWLIKALRLVHSKKPGDQERLRKMYKDACENEAAVSRMTIAEALREPRDSSRSDTPEREPPVTTSTRIRPAPSFTDPQTVNTQSASTGDPLTVTTSANPSDNSASVGPSSVQSPAAGKTSKRTKVAFFNMFDPSSSSSMRPTSNPTVGKSALSSSNPSSVVIDLTTSPSYQSAVRPVDVLVPTTTTTTTATTDVSQSCHTVSSMPGSLNTTAIDLTVTESVTQAAGSSSSSSTTQDKLAGPADAHFVASLVADLTCCVCGKITPQPQLEPDGKTMSSNVLVECCQCGALYHQLCHQPPVLSSRGTNPQQWLCTNCIPVAEPTTLSDPVVLIETFSTDATSDVRLTPSPAPNTGARKRKAGLTSSAMSSSIRRL
ncbi:uro-adherence factor A precursor [Clonorchis sinensis]|uniref:Uro-adherence factor A n=1 Tax=Clonorchis sinensis TaxID=79923 RepID=G7YEY8_CLOSI|nr:uro-adherence factor A precursor [Clonorchis sinensis]